ncbi:AraC family ligand binding domain-containing protein [Streptosporangium sp. H16]|uniref:AraC family ligand binding domain-containing protein n=1 Tax=Streptosporangium sp. H16 TaxID=3444184 RepID=UPI003F7AC7DD
MTARRPPPTIRAWRPPVAGIAEVFHAHFTDHAYPAHTHDTWDLMILDAGAVDFGLDRHRHGAADPAAVVLLPPGVPHDGRTVTPAGFRKKVLYLDTTVLPEHLTGTSAPHPPVTPRGPEGRESRPASVRRGVSGRSGPGGQVRGVGRAASRKASRAAAASMFSLLPSR